MTAEQLANHKIQFKNQQRQIDGLKSGDMNMSSEIQNIQKVLRGESQKESKDIGNVVQEEKKIEGEISGLRKNEGAIKTGLEQMDQSYKG